MPRPFRLVVGGVFVVYLGFVAKLVLSPSSSISDRAIVDVVTAAERFGVLLPVPSAEFALNVLLVVPLTLLGGLLFPRARPNAWVAAAFVASLIVELIQLVGLSGRTGSSQDIVANTLGAFLGSLLLVMVREVIAAINLDHRRERRPAPGRPNLWRSFLSGAYLIYLAAVFYLVWTPSPSGPGRSVLSVVDLAGKLGLGITTSAAERGLNVVMLVPLSLMGGLLIRRFSFSDWVVAGFVLSVGIESVQRMVLPTRTASAGDIVANTLGSLIGALILTIVLFLCVRRPPRPRGDTTRAAHAGSMLR